MVKQMHMKEGLGAEQGLRISVVGGGCSGFQYSLSFDAHKEGDTEQEMSKARKSLSMKSRCPTSRHHAGLRRGLARRRVPVAIRAPAAPAVAGRRSAPERGSIFIQVDFDRPYACAGGLFLCKE